MKKALSGGVPGLEPARLDRLLAEWAEPLKARVPAAVGPAAAAMELAERHADEDAALLGPVLLRLALAYLTTPAHRRGGSRDPVARFHLTNGARLERINPLADDSPRGRELAFGVMVNYLYDLEDIEKNHEAYAENRTIVASNAIRRLARSAPKELVPAGD